MTKSMKAVRDRKTDNRRISQNMEKALRRKWRKYLDIRIASTKTGCSECC